MGKREMENVSINFIIKYFCMCLFGVVLLELSIVKNDLRIYSNSFTPSLYNHVKCFIVFVWIKQKLRNFWQEWMKI